VSAQVESGNVYLPHPEITPWVQDFIEEVVSFPKGSYDDQVDAMTQALNQLRGYSGFSVPASQITEDPFNIPEGWPREYGMVVTRSSVGALWGARDPGGTIHLYAEHLFHDTDPSRNAVAIRKLGGWIPGFINFSRLKGSEKEHWAIVDMYSQLGLNVQPSVQGDEAGVLQVLHLLAANKLKIFSSLAGFLDEYRIGDEQSPSMLCCQSLVLSRDQMDIKRAPIRFDDDPPSNCGILGWMGR
jgi:hypothetical protein